MVPLAAELHDAVAAAHMAAQVVTRNVRRIVGYVQGLMPVPIHVEAAAVLAHGDAIALVLVAGEGPVGERGVVQVAPSHPETGGVVHMPEVGTVTGADLVAVASMAKDIAFPTPQKPSRNSSLCS